VILASFKFVMDLERATAHDIAEVCLKHVSSISRSRILAKLILACKRYLGPVSDVSGQTRRVAADVPGCSQEIPSFHELH
jgi:hypothetical protein